MQSGGRDSIRLKSVPTRTTRATTPSLYPLSLPQETSRNTSSWADFSMNQTMHEGSPLLSPEAVDSETLMPGGAGKQNDLHDYYEETKSVWYMILLTIGMGGLQLAWSVELSNGTPYLMSLGLSKSMMALVWIAGPLSGALVQPYVGMLSDKCQSSWGKRTPFIIFGSLATIFSLLTLAWTRDLVAGFLGIFGVDLKSEGAKNCTIIMAVLLVYMLDFSINTVQAGIRAFILDCAPSHQQETANSMASRALGVGNILGYITGYIDLKHYMWFFGNTQFKILCVNASLILGATVFLSLSTIRERETRKETRTNSVQTGIVPFFKSVVTSIKRLPPLTRKVCKIQFFAWIGIFPQLFYSSSYIGDIYVQPYLMENPHISPPELDQLYEDATRVGSFALLIYAITSLATNLLLPFFISPSYDSTRSRFSIPGLTLRRAWMASHLIFSACMFSTAFVSSISAATTLIGMVGISWALSLWAPFAIISAEVSTRNTLHRNLIAAPHHADYQSSDIEDSEDQAGVILGIHNIFVTVPQILATIASSIIFKFFQEPRGTPGDKSFSIVLAAGSLSTFVAAWLTSRMPDQITFKKKENRIRG